MKLRKTFRTSQMLDMYELNGKPFSLRGPLDDSLYNEAIVGPMFVINIEGRRIDAFQDEIYDAEEGEIYTSVGVYPHS